VRETSRIVAGQFGGRVPDTMEQLLALPGVGRKTANLVLIVAHASRANICVDTHVHRIANRLGWVSTKTPEQTERALYKAAPRRWWSEINLHLVTWGQNVCRPVYPLCPSCEISRWCEKRGVTRVGHGSARAIRLED
jgi:endonuclease-3